MGTKAEKVETDRIRLGVSACLLGEKVRYDGGHKRDRFLTDTFGRYVDWVAVCPEVECGLPTPRPSMRLMGDPADPRLVVTRTGEDLTAQMKRYASRRVRELVGEDLLGFIFKAKSPSSGMERVRVYTDTGMPAHTGVGLFARAFMDRFPLLPVEEEGRLHDLAIRENFIDRIFCLHRYRSQLKPRGGMKQLVAFHAAQKYQLMAHSPALLRDMGRLVAGGKQVSFSELLGRYEALLLTALKQRATPAKHQNVLQHMMGYFKKELAAGEKQEMAELIDRYRQGVVPLVVPVTLVAHFVRKYAVAYLAEQSYLNPHPVELKLRNHA